MNMQTPKPNKIRNATKIEQDGIKFDSRLELYLYNQSKAAGLNFEFQKKIELQKKFRYRGELIRPIAIVFDFWFPDQNVLSDSKGWQLADNKLKHKLLKYRLARFYEAKGLPPPEITMPSNKKQVDELVERLKNTHNE